MSFASWLRGLTRGSVSTLKKARPFARRARSRPSVERLEDRALLTAAYGLGYAFGLGSIGGETANDMATDPSGNVVVAGFFGLGSPSLDLDPGPGTYSLPNAGGLGDGFAAKYDPDGNLLWGVQVGGTGNDTVTKVAVDGAGNVLISGGFTGTVDIGAPAAGLAHVSLTNGGSTEWFLAKIDPAGNTLWATSFGSSASRFVSAITADAAGNVYATGHEGNQLFVSKWSADGASMWTQVVSGVTGTTYTVLGSGVAVDASSNVYVTGSYLGKIDFNPAPNQTNWLTSAGSYDAFVLKLDANGTYVRAGSMGGQGGDVASGIALDSTGNVYVNGGFAADSKADFDPGSGRLNLPNGGSFVVKLDPNLNAIWGRSGVTGSVPSRKMAVDAAGNVYTSETFNGTIDIDPGPGTRMVTAGGGQDVLISKLDSAGNFVWAGILGGPGSGLDYGNRIAADDSGNIYTVGFFRGTADFDPGLGEYLLNSTPDSTGNATVDAFVCKLIQTDAPPPPPVTSLSINDVSFSEGNSGPTTATFTVTRSGDTAQEVTVAYATADGSATAGSDYQTASGTLTFAPGETSKTISVLVNGDRVPELNETFVVNLGGATNANITHGQGVGTIMDDEPRISISDVSKKEGKKGQTTSFTFTVTLSAAYDEAVTMSFQTVNGTATTSDSDYVAQTGTLTFKPGETTKTITIQVKGDSKKEANETFYLDLFDNSSNALFTKNRGIGTILNDD
jgi:Calx-beta domain/Beta-propeller repeat